MDWKVFILVLPPVRYHRRFAKPLVPMFWISGDISSGFQSQNGLHYLHHRGNCNVCSLRSTSCATPTDIFDNQLAINSFSHTVANRCEVVCYFMLKENCTQIYKQFKCFKNKFYYFAILLIQLGLNEIWRILVAVVSLKWVTYVCHMQRSFVTLLLQIGNCNHLQKWKKWIYLNTK